MTAWPGLAWADDWLMADDWPDDCLMTWLMADDLADAWLAG